MKISFLVTYYNQKEYVKQSLDSILNIEKPCDWEIIVGDDGSDDGTTDVVLEYIKRYPDNISMHIMSRDIKGKYDLVNRASRNRLNALKHSTGDLFCVLDGDDYYCNTSFVKRTVEIYEQHQDISVVAFGYSTFTDGQLLQKYNLIDNYEGYIKKEDYIKNYYTPAGACVFSAKWKEQRIEYLYDNGFFDDNNILMNNLDFGELYYIDECVYAYRQSGVSIYTSMNDLEQALLNMQGFDMDVRLIDKTYYEALLYRYGRFIYKCYVWRKQLLDILGQEKYEKYLFGCENIENALSYKILTFDTLNKTEQKEVRKTIKLIEKMIPQLAVKMKLKYYLRGIR